MAAADTAKTCNRDALGTKLRLLGPGDPADGTAECGCVVERFGCGWCNSGRCFRHIGGPASSGAPESIVESGTVTPACSGAQDWDRGCDLAATLRHESPSPGEEENRRVPV